jgi:hypothetical protein
LPINLHLTAIMIACILNAVAARLPKERRRMRPSRRAQSGPHPFPRNGGCIAATWGADIFAQAIAAEHIGKKDGLMFSGTLEHGDPQVIAAEMFTSIHLGPQCPKMSGFVRSGKDVSAPAYRRHSCRLPLEPARMPGRGTGLLWHRHSCRCRLPRPAMPPHLPLQAGAGKNAGPTSCPPQLSPRKREEGCVTYSLDGNILNLLSVSHLWRMTIEKEACFMSFYVRASNSNNGRFVALQAD